MSKLASNIFFSVIIPTFNAELYVEQCLFSILKQTYEYFEIIVIDKYSTDGTYDKVMKISKNNDKLSFFLSNDNGIYDAMNKGVNYSNGNWIYFMGADDRLFDENVLALVSQKVLNSKSKLIYGNVIFRYSGVNYGEEFNSNKLIEEKNICHQAIFYHKSTFSVIGHFNTHCSVYADRDFNIRCFLNSKYTKPLYLNSTIAIYNELDGFSAKNEDDYFRMLQLEYQRILKKSLKYRINKTFKNLFFSINALYNKL